MKQIIDKTLINENLASQENATQYLRDLQKTLDEAKQGSTLALVREHMDKAITRLEHTNENIKLLISA